jgi:uncharacterized membrane protein
MNWYPTIPGWDGLHPALVMFPVVLLLVTPVLLFASLFARGAWRAWAGAALVTMVLGTLGTWLAVSSGHAAGQLVDKTKELEAVILRHEALGVYARNVFTLVTAVYVVLFLLPNWIKRPIPAAVRITVCALFLVGYVYATGAIARVADAGGRLVHQRGVLAYVEAQAARINPAPAATPTPPAAPARRP